MTESRNSDIYTPVLIAASLAITRRWKQPMCPSVDGWLHQCGSYTQWNVTQLLRKKDILAQAPTWMLQHR